MMTSLSVDLNCDLGESFGAYTMGNDQAILPYVTSANIACGYHAGDPLTMQKTVRLALQHKVAVGAHPGLPDLVGFGRREMAVTAAEVFAMSVYQIGALHAIAKAEGATLHHVKPHGALYNMAAVKPELAQAIAEAMYKACPEAVLYGLAGSALIEAGKKLGLKTAQEVFADRTYQQDGTLTPRSLADALITDPQKALQQVMEMIQKGKVTSQQGTEVTIQADTVCIHGDGPHALEFAKYLHHKLAQSGIRLKTI